MMGMRLERRHALWLLIVAAHASLLFLAPQQRPPERRPGASSVVRLILPPPPRTRPPHPSAAEQPAAPVARRQRSGEPVLPASPTVSIPTTPAPVEAPVAEARAPSDTTPGPLLQSEATQRAIREAARQPLLSERAAFASQDPGRENAQARLGREIQQAGTTDCLKGDFAGAGMGLLSLPFWLAAEARGKCKR
jgi:hypothetical protein